MDWALPTSQRDLGNLPGRALVSSGLRRMGRKRIGLGFIGFAFVVATFAFVLPKIADYRDVWDVVERSLLAVARRSGGRHGPQRDDVRPALAGCAPRVCASCWCSMMTQASTALSIVAPGGVAVGMAGQVGILRAWGFASSLIARAVTLTSLWNQFANLSLPR